MSPLNESPRQSFSHRPAQAAGVRVRPAVRSDGPKVVDTLAGAFTDCPFFNWLVVQDQDADRRRKLVFDAFVNVLGFERGEVWTTDDQRGAAIWYQPGQWRMNASGLFGFLPLFLKAAGPARSWQKFIGLNKLERRHPPEPHFYLLTLGVAPSRQRQGYGRELLRPLLKRCDERRFPAYLETADDENIPIYERYGFTMQETFDLSFGGPTIWTMRRNPADFQIRS